jgi:phasin
MQLAVSGFRLKPPRETPMQNTPNFPELPDSIRSIMKSSIEQARKAFDTFAASSEKILQGLDTSSNPVADNLKHLNEKIALFTRQNAEANFNLAMRLTDARQLSEIVELQNAHVREQMETFSRQLEELRELTMKAVKDGSKAASAAAQSPVNAAPQNPYFGS